MRGLIKFVAGAACVYGVGFVCHMAGYFDGYKDSVEGKPHEFLARHAKAEQKRREAYDEVFKEFVAGYNMAGEASKDDNNESDKSN